MGTSKTVCKIASLSEGGQATGVNEAGLMMRGEGIRGGPRRAQCEWGSGSCPHFPPGASLPVGWEGLGVGAAARLVSLRAMGHRM